MRTVSVLLATALTGCATPPAVEVEPGVSWTLAERRAATISELLYDVSFSIPADRSEAITGRVTARFVLADAGPVVLDFAQPADHVHAVAVVGEAWDFEVRDEHIVVPAVAAGEVALTVDFTAGDGSLNRQDDFLYTLFVPDRARVAFPLFDQPNLKARYRLSLEIPDDWEAVGNGSVVSQEEDAGRARLGFAETEPISSYLFAFAVGAFETETAERDGRSMTMYHRETDRERVERNRDAIFDLHASALAWLEDYVGAPFPFEKFDFVAVPSFQYGGMEHPGSIFYRAEGLFLDESATENAYLGRASLIAHETAHQWFGDLVTMEWFTDVWMKETFANFMAAKIVNPSFPEVDHELRFLLAHYPAAYGVDRTAGANPIRQPLDNLNEAGTLYGPIIYQKAPIVIQQLERLLGEEPLRYGLREYLDRYAYDNAEWEDLIAILDRRTDEDLAVWSQVWVNESGRPRVRVELTGAEERVSRLRLTQEDPGSAGRLWNQRLDVLFGYADGGLRTFPVQLRSDIVDVPAVVGEVMPDYVLANGAGVGYGLMELDPRSRAFLLESLPSIPSPLVRAIAWTSLWDGVLEAAVEPMAFVELAMQALPRETDRQNVSLVLGHLQTAYWRWLGPPDRAEVAAPLEVLLWTELEGAPGPREAAAYFNAYRNIATSEPALHRLHRVWNGDESVPGVPLSERDLTTLALELAVRGIEDSEGMLDTQLDRIENPDRRAELTFVRDAVSADPDVRRRFFARLADERRRERETWVLRGVRYLHHPLRAQTAEPHLRPSLELLEEIQRTGDIFFPDRWLGATLGGHQTATAAATVEQFLVERPDLPPRLRAKVLQAADGLIRASRIVEVGGTP